jgi:hypothetical protein
MKTSNTFKIKLDANKPEITAVNPEIVITEPTPKNFGLVLRISDTTIELSQTPEDNLESYSCLFLDETQIRKIQPILTHWINTKNALQNYEKEEAKK